MLAHPLPIGAKEADMLRGNHDAMMVVRADLTDRLEQLRLVAGHIGAADFERRLEGIRSTACAYGLGPVARLAEAVLGGGAPRALYFERMRDAIGCERADPAAEQAMLASVSIRLGA
jgi:hypothetical protein